ncbi:hypothetical protein AVEN_240232-1, partial [Araneus ventricosus]
KGSDGTIVTDEKLRKTAESLLTAYAFIMHDPIHGGASVESGFEPRAIRPQSRDLTTKPPRPMRESNSIIYPTEESDAT